MVDWTSPETLFMQAADWNKLVLVFSGIYIYEFACSIPFDWMLMTRDDSQRSLLGRSVKWLYMVCRYSTLGACISGAVFGASHGHLRCTLLVKIINSTELFAVTSGTVLLFVRVGVVWNWNKWVTAAFTMAYTAVIALGIRAVVLIKAVALDIPLGPACAISGVEANLPNIFATLLVDVAVLLLLFAGLQRSNWSHARSHDLWHLLWHQGLIYLALAIVIEIPLTVFLFLNYNELMSLFFDAPLTIVLPIAATRLYRSLTNLAENRSHYTHESTASHTPRLPLPKTIARPPPGTLVDLQITDTTGTELEYMGPRPMQRRG